MTKTPEYLNKAKEIFFNELKEHLKYFENIAESEESLKAHAEEIKKRLHLLKGGAGFLQMTNLKELFEEIEKNFKDQSFKANLHSFKSFLKELKEKE